MKPVGIKLKFAVIGMLYGTFSCLPVVADDIEIYTASTSSTSAVFSRANILFVLDTSGSMDGLVTSLPPYNPASVYAGCFDTTRLYTQINFNGREVTGTTYTGPQMYCQPFGPMFGYDITTRDQFNATSFKCDSAVSPLTTAGFYTDRIAQYRLVSGSTRWRSVNGIDDNRLTQPVECRADQGVHGEVTGDGQPYATNSSGGWKSSAPGSLNWGSAGSSESIYTGNYLNYLVSETTILGTRLKVMQDALTDVINTSTGINIGLMRYDRGGDGGMVVTPMGEISATRADFIYELGLMYHDGNTPLAETFYEAVSYMQGDSVDYGVNSTGQNTVGSTAVSSKPSHPDSRTPSGGPDYKSPIIGECQKNFIVLLTDGEPTSDIVSTARQNRIGVTSCVDNCLDEIAAEIGQTDQNTFVSGDQFISTFTIGLETDQVLLKATAQASKSATGVGEYYPVKDAISLTAAFSNIVTQVLEIDSTFSSPAVSVNAFNRSTHLSDLYFTLFKPSNNPHWSGNFKKYKLDFAIDTIDADGDGNTTEKLPFIADKLGNPAINATTGFFDNGIVSYWTPTTSPDGPEVGEGGSAQHLTNARNVYTYPDSYTSTNGVLSPPTAKQSLTVSTNRLDKSNALITEAMLDIVGKPDFIPTIPYRESLLDWTKGLDIQDINLNGDLTDARLQIGDPLHAEPALVQYGQLATDSDGDGENDPDLVAYIATNDGYLHAVNTQTGTEYFSFIPKELLSNLSVIFDDNGSSPKSYGLDGSVVAWVKDTNKDGTVSGASEHVYLYIGMRRGGNYIYSLDVTDRNSPKLRWVIEGGTGDYAELGQTWSTPNVEKLKLNGVEKTVLIFGGGYDVNQDAVTERTADSVGRGVFIADAETGALLWRAGPDAAADLQLTDMDYSIPSRVKPLDVNGSGFIDHLYVGDMGGQLWRFDIKESNTSSDLATLITGGRIADFAVDSSAADTRRFYYPPDVALIVQAGKAPYLSILGATGYRAGPLDVNVHDRIYMIREDAIYSAPKVSGSVQYTTLTEANLYDTTSNIIGQGNSTQKATAATSLTSAKGWYISLEELDGSFIGEKSLAEPLILNGVGILTTFIPDDTLTAINSCIPQAGTGSLYFLNVTDGTPTYNLSGTVSKTREDRKTYLKRGGIPPSPSVIVTEGGSAVAVGTELQNTGDLFKVQKTYWYEVEQQ